MGILRCCHLCFNFSNASRDAQLRVPLNTRVSSTTFKFVYHSLQITSLMFFFVRNFQKNSFNDGVHAESFGRRRSGLHSSRPCRDFGKADREAPVCQTTCKLNVSFQNSIRHYHILLESKYRKTSHQQGSADASNSHSDSSKSILQQ